MNNAFLLVSVFKEEIGSGVCVPHATGITMRARVRPIFFPVSMMIFGIAPFLAETWSQASTEAPGISVVLGSPDLTTRALPDAPALPEIVAEWDWHGRNAMKAMSVAQATYGQPLHRPPSAIEGSFAIKSLIRSPMAGPMSGGLQMTIPASLVCRGMIDA